jgi:hypothetical protein
MGRACTLWPDSKAACVGTDVRCSTRWDGWARLDVTHLSDTSAGGGECFKDPWATTITRAGAHRRQLSDDHQGLIQRCRDRRRAGRLDAGPRLDRGRTIRKRRAFAWLISSPTWTTCQLMGMPAM